MFMIKNIDEYTLKKQSIGKIDIYIILPERYGEFLNALNYDDELIDGLDFMEHKRKYTAYIVQTVSSIKSAKLYLAINHNRYMSAVRFAWAPMMCLKMGEDFYPVYYVEGWRCRDCMGDNGEVLVPLIDMERDYFIGIDPKIIREKEPAVFHHLFCKYCGHMMSGYLLKL